MNADPVIVEADIDTHILATAGRPHRPPPLVPGALRWRTNDPWAVQLHLACLTEPWVIGWDLLVDAAGTGHAGSEYGRIRVRRATPTTYEIELGNRNGSALLRIDSRDLGAFVAAVQPRQPSAAYRAAAAANAGLRGLLDGEPR